MSLINKMLQDLDSRGSGPAGSLAASVKLAPPTERHISWPLVIGVIAVAAIAAVAGVAFWRVYKPLQAMPSAADRIKLASASKATAPIAPPAALLPQPKVDATGDAIVPSQLASAAAASTSASVASASAAASVPAGAAVANDAATKAPAEHGSAGNPLAANIPAANATSNSAAGTPNANAGNDAAAASASAAAPKAKPAAALAKASAKPGAKSRKDAKAAKATKVASAPSAGLELSNAQRAESEYRRGLVSLQEGRNGEAINAFEQALRLEPQHEAARQTVVGLLIEARRSEEAVRHLQLGLTLEPRQPAMAMLLARLQIERGVSGIETLMRTLPYATGNGEYHAFLAGALARESRHQEAAEQYRLALRGAPQNGLWLIGLGISLQTEKRDAEALDAFKRAKASGALSPELLTYAERRINALSR
jgi:MSHA biogenesis protein MshN